MALEAEMTSRKAVGKNFLYDSGKTSGGFNFHRAKFPTIRYWQLGY